MSHSRSVYHDSTHQDLENLIHSLARHWAKRIGLSWDTHGDDLVQTGWLTTVRVSRIYKPMGFKFITYAYLSINRDIRKAATVIATNERTTGTLDSVYEYGLSTKPSTRDRDGSGVDPLNRDAEFTFAIKELLSTTDGLELLAAELGYEDKTKTGRRIRAEQIDQLRARYMQLKEAA